MGSQKDKIPAAKSLYRSSFLDNDIWHCLLVATISLIYQRRCLRLIVSYVPPNKLDSQCYR